GVKTEKDEPPDWPCRKCEWFGLFCAHIAHFLLRGNEFSAPNARHQRRAQHLKYERLLDTRLLHAVAGRRPEVSYVMSTPIFLNSCSAEWRIFGSGSWSASVRAGTALLPIFPIALETALRTSIFHSLRSGISDGTASFASGPISPNFVA